MTFEFSKAFSPKVTTPPPKPKSKIGFRTATFLVKDTPGIPGIWWIKNDIILVGFRVDNYCLLRTRSTEWWERKRSELKPISLVRGSLTDTSATNRPDFKINLFFFFQYRPFSTENSWAVILFPHKPVPASKQCIWGGAVHPCPWLPTLASALQKLLLGGHGYPMSWTGNRSGWKPAHFG